MTRKEKREEGRLNRNPSQLAQLESLLWSRLKAGMVATSPIGWQTTALRPQDWFHNPRRVHSDGWVEPRMSRDWSVCAACAPMASMASVQQNSTKSSYKLYTNKKNLISVNLVLLDSQFSVFLQPLLAASAGQTIGCRSCMF